MADSQEDEKNIQHQLQELIQLVKQEKLDPNILPYSRSLFEEVQKEVKKQQDKLKQYITPDAEDETELFEKNFMFLLYKAEIEKVSYILKQYLKLRLRKISVYCFYLVKNQAIADQMLSAAELDFLKTYAELRFRYYRDNVLKHFAKHFRDFRELEFYLGKNEGDKKEKSLFVQTKQSLIDIIAPHTQQYCFILILNNSKQQLRFGIDIKAANITQAYNDVIPQRSVLFCPYADIADKMDPSDYKLI